MRINGYDFGRIVIDEKTYTADVIIGPDGVDSSWWRQEGHHLVAEDLPQVLAAPPDVLIIGTGHSGRMAVAPDAVEKFRALGIRVIVADTNGAAEMFNSLSRGEAKVVAALHLTC